MDFCKRGSMLLLLIATISWPVIPAKRGYHHMVERERYQEKRDDADDKPLSNAYIKGVLNLKGKILTNQIVPVELMDANAEFKLAAATRSNTDLLMSNSSIRNDRAMYLPQFNGRLIREADKANLTTAAREHSDSSGLQHAAPKVDTAAHYADKTLRQRNLMKSLADHIGGSLKSLSRKYSNSDKEETPSVADVPNYSEGSFRIMVDSSPVKATDDKILDECTAPDTMKMDSNIHPVRGDETVQRGMPKYTKSPGGYPYTKRGVKRKRKEHPQKRNKLKKHARMRMTSM